MCIFLPLFTCSDEMSDGESSELLSDSPVIWEPLLSDSTLKVGLWLPSCDRTDSV